MKQTITSFQLDLSNKSVEYVSRGNESNFDSARFSDSVTAVAKSLEDLAVKHSSFHKSWKRITSSPQPIRFEVLDAPLSLDCFGTRTSNPSKIISLSKSFPTLLEKECGKELATSILFHALSQYSGFSDRESIHLLLMMFSAFSQDQQHKFNNLLLSIPQGETVSFFLEDVFNAALLTDKLEREGHNVEPKLVEQYLQKDSYSLEVLSFPCVLNF